MAKMQKETSQTLLRRFAGDEQGSMTVWGLFVFLVCGILGALAMDVTYLIASRTHLQVAADQAAHAAIYQRYLIDDEDGVEASEVADVKTLAADLARATLPTGRYGIALEEADINFGTYDFASGTFTIDETSASAARARSYFTTANGNPAISFLFRLIGRDTFDVSAEAIFVAYGKVCLNEGYVANNRVDLQSNNDFGENFCIHSNSHVEVNQNNTYGMGSIVSMPDIEDLTIPGGITYVTDDAGNVVLGEDGLPLIDDSNFDKNEGLIEALTPAYIDLRILDRVENMIYRYQNPDAAPSSYPHPLVVNDTEGWPSYIDTLNFVDPLNFNATSITTEEILARGTVEAIPTLDADGLPVFDIETGEQLFDQVGSDGKGRVYYITCQNGNGGGNNGNDNGNANDNGNDPTLTIDASTTPISDMIIISPCEIKFANGSAVENARIVSTSTSDDSISGTNGMLVGRSGSCDHGAQLLTMGGIRFPADLELAGSQMIALGNVQFAAGANGVKGASIIAGGEIDATSNGDMEICGNGMSNNVKITYFRMAL